MSAMGCAMLRARGHATQRSPQGRVGTGEGGAGTRPRRGGHANRGLGKGSGPRRDASAPDGVWRRDAAPARGRCATEGYVDAPSAGFFSSLRSVTRVSVVSMRPAMEAAFWSALRTTFVGSMMPASYMDTILRAFAS